jgi:hypothetical protein
MTFWPVDRRVGNVRNDTPDLFAPIAEPPPNVPGNNRRLDLLT